MAFSTLNIFLQQLSAQLGQVLLPIFPKIASILPPDLRYP
tara:strand:+ start:155 stop:274 length:120 start_codon:yes stop_codon:yes gene_type:complete